MVGDSLGIIDSRAFAATLDEVHSGATASVPSLLRVFGIERWLRNVAHWNVLEDLDTYAPKLMLFGNDTGAPPGRALETSLS